MQELWKHSGCVKQVSNSLPEVCDYNQRPLAGNIADFDLSRNKSLRTLEILASSFVDAGPGFFTHVLSTITSPLFSEVVVVYRDYNIYGLPSPWVPSTPMPYCMQFAVLRKMHKVRAFQLVLCADVWDCVVADAVRALKQAVAEERVKELSGGFFPEPLVVSSSRGSSPTFPELVGAGYPVPHDKNISDR